MSDQVMEREDDGAHVIEASTPLQVVTKHAAPTMVLTEARIGPPGAPGEIGPAGGTAFARVSDGALSALRIVWEDGAGVVRMLDYRDADHVDLLAGLTLTATAAAGPVTVQRAGPVDDDAWSWAAGRVWLGADGIPTQTPPADGYDVLIGYAVSPTRLYLDIQDHINLEQ